MINPPAFQPQVTQTGALQDTIDRVSPMVGYNINNYVFGDLNSPANPNLQLNKSAAVKEKGKEFLGAALLLGGAIGTFALLFKGKLPKIKLPFNLDSLKNIFKKK